MATEWITTGVTRNVLLWRRWAFKVVKGRNVLQVTRAWLGNQSEWQQRKRRRVNRPVLTLFHFVVVYPRALHALSDGVDTVRLNEGYIHDIFEGDEAKTSSWGIFDDGSYKLIDYDRAWEEPKGLVGRLYYWNQERLARKWSKLPEG